MTLNFGFVTNSNNLEERVVEKTLEKASEVELVDVTWNKGM